MRTVKHGTRNEYRYGCRCDECRAANAEHAREYNAKYRKKPGFLERQRELCSQWRATEYGASRRRLHHTANKAGVRVSSLSHEMQALLTAIYLNCPDGYQVDHIVPLAKGGAHEPDNLQYLPATINNRKRSRLDFDCAAHAIRWQDVLKVDPPTTIPQGSRAKRPEVPSTPLG